MIERLNKSPTIRIEVSGSSIIGEFEAAGGERFDQCQAVFARQANSWVEQQVFAP